MHHRKLTQEELVIYPTIKRKTAKTNHLYEKVKRKLGITKIGHSKGYIKHTCYRYKYLFKVYLSEMDICHRDYWQFDFAKTMYDKKLRLRNRLYAQFKNQKIEVIDQEGNIYTTTPDQIIHHREVHELEFVGVFQQEVA
jgi:hypothetical protein